MGNIGDSRAISPLTEMAFSDINYDAWKNWDSTVVEALQKLGTEAVPSVIKIAESGKIDAIYSLGHMGDCALKPLTLFLEHENEEICKAAIGALGTLHYENVTIPENVIDKIINFIEVDAKSIEIREETIRVLGQIGSTNAVEPLIGFIEGIPITNDEERHAIMHYDNPNTYSYTYAINSLGQIGDKRALDILLKVLNKYATNADKLSRSMQDYYQILPNLTMALGNLGDKRAVAPLLKILEKGEGTHHITQALQKLGHEVE